MKILQEPKVGEILYCKYKDHFQVDENNKEYCTQEQIGFFVWETPEFIFLSLSKHEYDQEHILYEEQIGILKVAIEILIPLKEE